MPQSNDLSFALVMLVMLTGLGIGLLTLTRHHRESLAWQGRLFVVAFVVRFLASLVVYEFGLVRVLGDEDSSGWLGGVVQMQQWMQQKVGWLDLPEALAGVFFQQQQGYRYMLGALFFVTDAPARMPAAALNCFFGALTVVFTYRIADSLFSQWVAVRVGWAACFFPSLIIWSAQTVKEPVVILLEIVALYACVHLRLEGFSLRYILICGAAIILLLPFRFYAAYLAAAAALLALLVPQIGKRATSVYAALAIAILVIPLAVSSGILARSEAQFERFDLNYVSSYQRGLAMGQKSGVTPNYDLRTPDGLVWGMLVGGAHLLLAPFPWQLGGASLRMLLVLPEQMVWWWLFFVGVLPGFWLAVRRRFGELQSLLIFSGGLGFLYSLLFGNIGLAVRQRAQLLPLLLIFAMVGLEQRAIRKRQRQQEKGARFIPLVRKPDLTNGRI
jgi:hypothetical protein